MSSTNGTSHETSLKSLSHDPDMQMPFLIPVTCRVVDERALAPGQGVLERVEEVPQDPGQDGVVEHAHQERHHHAGYACATREAVSRSLIFNVVPPATVMSYRRGHTVYL